MISRRTVLPALALLGTAAAAGLWRPTQVSANEQWPLEEIVPQRFGEWSVIPHSKVVQPEEPDDLAREIYSQELSRGYRNTDGAYIMLLMAYGPSQSEYLQLHQPEICYVAQGFRVKPVTGAPLLLQGGRELFLRRLSTWRAGRPEPVSYWTRIGDSITRSQLDRLLVKFHYGLVGLVPDGILVRVSSISQDLPPAFELQDKFIVQMLQAVAPQSRRFLIGGLAPDVPA